MGAYGNITLAHGSGGKLSRDLAELFAGKFSSDILSQLGDSGVVELSGVRVAFTTDSYVVKPLFFPGGDIGKLAVCGTVNDLSVAGAQPAYITCSLIIEEGFGTETLGRVIDSMASAARDIGVEVVTGDTKVVERGSCDGLFVNTAGIGLMLPGADLSLERVEPGDKIILNGTVGDHGMAVLSQREGMKFKGHMESDCAPLNELISRLLGSCDGVKFMRDPTRGGLATVLNEIAQGSGYAVVVDEKDVPVREEVRGLCELLGIDPLYVANEGKVLAVVRGERAEEALEIMKSHHLGRESCILGEVVSGPPGKVGLKTAIGGTRLLPMLRGDQLPRIC